MSVSATLAFEVEAYQALLRDTRAHEARCGAFVERVLSTPPVSPDDDTLDADEDPTLPPPPHVQEHAR
jgi:hypothetical protein